MFTYPMCLRYLQACAMLLDWRWPEESVQWTQRSNLRCPVTLCIAKKEKKHQKGESSRAGVPNGYSVGVRSMRNKPAM